MPNKQTLDLEQFVDADILATDIANKYVEWEEYRRSWMAEKRELRNYIFATDTSTTSTNDLGWKNSVHIPKLCQIRDNLYANYTAAMFPHDRAIKWEGDDRTAATKAKRQVIEAYINNKLRMSKFKNEVGRCLYDFIDWGNAFAKVEFVRESTIDTQTGEEILGYVGPRLRRISPTEIVFNPNAASFEETPKIIRSLRTLGSLKAEMETNPESGYLQEVFEKSMNLRQQFRGYTEGDFNVSNGFQMDGFSSYLDYMSGDMVEILEFYGDLYDMENEKLYKNHVITIIDRAYVIRKEPNPSWLGHAGIFHVGWRLRPDNLYAMGPLDNLVGMQYRIDHLENAKSDAYDLIIHPVIKIKGDVSEFKYGPGEEIYVGDEGEVEFMAPDTTMLSADTQIAIYEQKMEEMAGAPKQAMGFRTPGEKTAFEVQILENGANKVFLNKTAYFEEMFLEPIVNSMLEVGRRLMGPSDAIKIMDDDFNVSRFLTIRREDITAKGKLRPIGARHFARNANILQNLVQLSSSPLGQDPAVISHISGKKVAQLMEELLDLEKFELYGDNVRIAEQMETQQIAAGAQQQMMENGQLPIPTEEEQGRPTQSGMAPGMQNRPR